MSRTLSIVLRPEAAGDDRDLLRTRLEAFAGVLTARRLAPDSVVPEVQRMWVAEVKDGADPEEVASQLSTLPEVESATPAAPRRLS
jgi:hypothetical protein